MTPGRIFFWLLAGLLVLAAVPLVFFLQWRTERLEQLSRESFIVNSLLGPVEFVDTGGEGPPVLVLHGAGGGYDQGLLLAKDLADAGHRVIAISRPGYLRTPIASGVFPEQQADLAAILLRILRVESAGVLAFSEAAPVALQLAARHSDLVKRAALVSPVILRPRPPESGKFSLPAEVILRVVSGDVDSWLLASQLRWQTQQTIKELLSLETDLKEFPVLQLSREIAEQPESTERLQEFFSTLAPFSPREIGTRNDIVQMRGLPELPLKEINMPVLVLRGESDGVTAPENVENLHEALDRIEIHEVPQAGFLLPGYGPSADEAIELLLEFFRATPGSNH